MQTVSTEYKKEIQNHIRNRGHIRVTIGVVNQTAQADATILNTQNRLAYYCVANGNNIFNGYSNTVQYAADEQDFTRVDGSMFFLPTDGSGAEYYNTGVTTEALKAAIYISFGNMNDLDIKGLTIDFGECYPTTFIVETDNKTVQYSNDQRYFSTEDTFNGVSYFKITPVSLVNGNGRLRILSLNFGISNIFNDAHIEDFDEKDYVSPVTDSVPSRDMNITVDNRDQYYSPDNPESAIAYMEVGQRVSVQFGYDLDAYGNSVEWLPETTAYLSEWSATDSTATFTATDKFYSMTGTYYKGLYRSSGISLYDLAVDVFNDAGITDANDYYIDLYLKNIIVYNPLPPVNHASALQIIANAGRCVLFEDREGKICLKSSFVPDVEVSTNGETAYSHSQDIINNQDKRAYAIDSYNFTPVNGSVRFMAENGDYIDTGYISNSLWVVSRTQLGQQLPIGAVSIPMTRVSQNDDTDQHWTNGEPKLTLTLEAEYSAYGLDIKFREQAPRRFKVIIYNSGSMVGEKEYYNLDTTFSTRDAFEAFDKMEIVFTEGYPNARVTIDNISFGEMTDYVIRRDDMTDSPTAVRQRRLKAVTVARDTYAQTTEKKDISSETIVVSPEDTDYYIYLQNASYGYTVTVTDVSGVTASVTDSSSYFAKISFSGITQETTLTYTLSGYEYAVSELMVSREYHSDGEEIIWSNPLISTTDHANDLAEWLSTYYLGDVQYDVTWRGDPRLDANDLLYMELKDRDAVIIRSYQNELSYNGAWHGAFQARKVVM